MGYGLFISSEKVRHFRSTPRSAGVDRKLCLCRMGIYSRYLL